MEKVRPKKHLGQHFLQDMRVAAKLAMLTQRSAEPILVEIGPGMGVLTEYLRADAQKELYLVEIDEESVKFLHHKYPDLQEHLIQGDFLKIDLPLRLKEPFILCGNYPYNISSQIVFRMLDWREHIPFMCGMFQFEMARRIAASPGSKDYGIISVLTQTWYEVKLEFSIEPGAFFPPPKVRSAVISCVRIPDRHLPVEAELYREVVKRAFGQRRKMLGNALSSFNIPKEAWDGHEFAKLRAENLGIEDFIALTQFVANALK